MGCCCLERYYLIDPPNLSINVSTDEVWPFSAATWTGVRSSYKKNYSSLKNRTEFGPYRAYLRQHGAWTWFWADSDLRLPLLHEEAFFLLCSGGSRSSNRRRSQLGLRLKMHNPKKLSQMINCLRQSKRKGQIDGSKLASCCFCKQAHDIFYWYRKMTLTTIWYYAIHTLHIQICALFISLLE